MPVQKQQQQQQLPKPSVKYNLPLKTFVSEFLTSVSLKFKVPSYMAESLRVQFVQQDHSSKEVSSNLLKINCESTSKSSGYTQYYEAYINLNFSNSSASPAPMLDEMNCQEVTLENAPGFGNSIRLVCLNEDFFEIKLVKKVRGSSEGTIKKASISLTEKPVDNNSVRDIDINLESIGDIDPEWDVEERAVSDVPDLNKMSRKDYILNFTSMASKEEKDSDEEDDEVEIEKPQLASKFAKLSHVEKQKFQKSKASKTSSSNQTVINTEIKVQEKIEEEPEHVVESSSVHFSNDDDTYDDHENDLSETEKDYLRSQAKNSKANSSLNNEADEEDEQDDDELAESHDTLGNNENSSGSLSSSANDSSTYSSSLNGSNSFCKLKVNFC
jgi:hypothetical protein